MRKLIALVACILTVSLMVSMLTAAQEPQPQADTGSAVIPQETADAGESTGESTGESAGDSANMSEEDVMALLQQLLQEAGNSEGTESEGAESAGESAGTPTKLEPPYGSPWLTSMDAGNIPEEAPAAVDDLIVHYTYDILKEHADGTTQYNGIGATSGELQEFVTAYIQDEANDSHELQQLRIFYDQAADFDARRAAGLSELQPYLDMVAGAQSIEELNAVLASEEFPFNPWTNLVVCSTAQDREENNNVFVLHELLFVEMMGEESLAESDDLTVQLIRQSMLMQGAMTVSDILTALGVPEEEASSLSNAMLELEKTYGKYCNLNDEKYLDFGVYADSLVTYTLDELTEISPNFPIGGILARFGKDKAQGYAVQVPEWLTTLNDLWTEENLDILKLMTQTKIVKECKDFIDPDIFLVSRTALKQPDPDPLTSAYSACNNNETFTHLIAKIYVEECLGQETVDKLTNMTLGLIDTYKPMIDSTSWIGEESKQKVLDKLNNMGLNILYPACGYFDFDDVELTKTEDGGTIIGNYLKLKDHFNLHENELLDQKAMCTMAWLAFPPTMANAYYNEFDNSINILPGIITSILYNKDMTDSRILGSIGTFVAHEISHGFDFRGSQTDQYGRTASILTEDDVEAFLAVYDKLAAYYSTIEYMPGKYIDGKRIITEAGADLNGIMVALAYAQTLPEYDLTQYFDGLSQAFVRVGPPGTSATFVTIDTHPLGYLRVNVNAQMFDEFYDTYGCKEGDGMYLAPEDRIRVWGDEE